MNICKNALLNTTFNCQLCGKEKTERTCWYRKRLNHFCSRLCANRFNSLNLSACTKPTEFNEEYWSDESIKERRRTFEREYWTKPENKERNKINKPKARLKRISTFGDSLKKEILNRARQRCLKSGIEFSITICDFEIPRTCPVLGIELALANTRGGLFNSPSLDRIDNNKGYISGNIQIISKRANTIKSDASIEEIEMLLNFLKINSLHFGNK